MKKRYLIYLLTLVMVLSPAAVFADVEPETAPEETSAAEELQTEVPSAVEEEAVVEEADVKEESPEPAVQLKGGEGEEGGEDPFVQTYPGWNEDRTIYFDKDGNRTTGLFKATMSDDVGALFYADYGSGIVQTTSGVITVPGDKVRFLRSKDEDDHWGFRKVAEDDKTPYT